MIKINNLTAYYQESDPILKDINLDIAQNKVTAIIGPSGCGKSTLLKVLNRLIIEEGGDFDGEILLNNRPIDEYNDQELRTSVGMVFQQATVFPLSIFDNLAFPLNYHYQLSRKETEKKVKRLLQDVGLYDEVVLSDKASRLSGGQQQRLSIARALSIEPEVLLLDEPCSQLDISNTILIEETIMHLKDKQTIVIVTHNLQQAERISDSIVFMYEGKIIEQGTTEQIFNHPRCSLTQDYLEGKME